MRFLLTGLLALPLFGQAPWVLPQPPETAAFLIDSIRRLPLALAQPPSAAPGLKFFPPGMLYRQRLASIRPGSLKEQAYARAQLNAALVEPPARPCAVPLKNALRAGASGPRIPTVRPPANAFHSHDIKVPAPSCDDLKTK